MFEVQVIQFGTKNDDDPFKPFLNLWHFTLLPNQALVSLFYLYIANNLNVEAYLNK